MCDPATSWDGHQRRPIRWRRAPGTWTPLRPAAHRGAANRPRHHAPDTTLGEFFSRHLLGNREKAVAVVGGARYLGIMGVDELQDVAQDRWAEPVGDHMRTDFPTATPGLSLRDALTLMEDADVDLLPVLDGGSFVGVVTTSEILSLDEILGRTSSEP